MNSTEETYMQVRKSDLIRVDFTPVDINRPKPMVVITVDEPTKSWFKWW